jgi:hypothetical protein
VELEAWCGLHPGLREDLLFEIAKLTGVRQVNDMEVLSPQTLAEWMLSDDESLVGKPPVKPKRKVKKDVLDGSAQSAGS